MTRAPRIDEIYVWGARFTQNDLNTPVYVTVTEYVILPFHIVAWRVPTYCTPRLDAAKTRCHFEKIKIAYGTMMTTPLASS